MSESRQLFPLGKAHGEAFCNREQETKQLAGNIKSSKHTLLIAPRRYGKSSLAERAIEKIRFPAVKINFHLSTSEEEIAQLILDNVIKLIGTAVGHVEKLMVSIKKYLSNLEPLLSFGNDIATLKLMPKKQANYSVIISEALLLVEKLLAEKNKRAVLFLDEFQEIDQISKHRGIEGAIRTAAQEMQYLTIIFSGSVRSLLLSMFESENRPLYKLCRKIKLDRIASTDYEKHIQKIAAATWGKLLEQSVFEYIMLLSNRHPYYVNYLCDSVWEICKQLPKVEDVEMAWKKVVAEEWSDALRELSELSLGQRRVLKYIASHEVKSLQSQETSKHLAMATSSIASAVNVLIEKDYLEQTATGSYQVINPLLLTVFKGIED
jgi:uncharacterized protein